MPAISVRRIPLADTRSYAAPGSGMPRVRMTPNGVTMLAAVNGHGAYDDYHGNGAKKHRRKAAKRTRKAARLRARARGKGVSATKRAKLYRKAKRKTKRAKRSTKRASWHKQVKKLAHKSGMTRKQLIALIRERTGMTQSQAKAEVKDAIGAGGSVTVPSYGWKTYGSSGYGSGTGDPHRHSDDPATLSYNGRRDTMSRNSLAGVKKYYRSISRHASKAEAKRALVKKFGSKLAQQALAGEGGNMARKTKKKGHRKARRRSRSTGYRSAARRKGRKAHRRVARRSRRTTRTRGRRRMRRNGADEFEENGSDEYEANGADEDDDFAPNKKRGKKKAKRKAAKAGKKGIFSNKMLRDLGVLRDAGNADPVASIVLDQLAERALNGSISVDQYKALRKQIAKSAFPAQKGSGKHMIPIQVTDPFSGKTKTVNVPWKGKIRTAFGPFKRRTKDGALSYEWEKGRHIPQWALVGAYSPKDYDVMVSKDPTWSAESNAIAARIHNLRLENAERHSKEIERKIEKLQAKLNRSLYSTPGGAGDSRYDEGMDAMTPNARGRGRRKSSRKGKRRMSAKQRAAFKKMIAAGARKRRGKGRRKARRSGKRRSSKRRSSKRSYKKNGRRSYGRRKARKSGKRRSTRGRSRGRKFGRRKARRSGKRRSSRRSSRGRRKTRGRGRRRMRRNGSETVLLSIAGATAGAVTHRYLKNFLLGQVGSSLSFAGSYAPLLVSALTAAAGAFALTKVADHFGGAIRDAYGAAIVGMFASFGLGAVVDLVPGIAGQLSGIPYLNTSGWGSRSLSAYELRGLGQYELRGLGASPQQALAAYELRGLGASPQQALAGGYAQALAGGYSQAMAAYELRGLGAEGILPSQADAALDMADQGGEADSLTMQGGEYVNTQLRPGLPEFWG